MVDSKKLNRKQIHALAISVLGSYPQGIRRSELARRVIERAPSTPENSIHGAIHNLLKSNDDITRIDRGLYRLAQLAEQSESDAIRRDEEESETPVAPSVPGPSLTEKDFYGAFAEWLVENDEASNAFPLGGAIFGGKWGTPDVIGVLKPRAGDVFRFEPQIVTAEIKAVTTQPVVAFGQAVAYKLFSHISYVVIPRSTDADDLSRLKSLCSIHGVGLAVFDLNKSAPNFSVIVIPSNTRPDMFYVNIALGKLRGNDPEMLDRLF